MDGLVRERMHAAFVFRFITVEDYAAALGVERAVKAGGLDAGPPRFNPQRDHRALQPADAELRRLAQFIARELEALHGLEPAFLPPPMLPSSTA